MSVVSQKSSDHILQLRTTHLRLGHATAFVNRGLASQTFGEPTVVQFAVGLALDPDTLLLASSKVLSCSPCQYGVH